MKYLKINFYFLFFFGLAPISSQADYLFCDVIAESAREYAIRRDSGEKMREMVKGVMEAAVAKQKSGAKISKKDLDLIVGVHIETIESIFEPSQINSSPEIIYNKKFKECMKMSRVNK